jgi:hypothetical protein
MLILILQNNKNISKADDLLCLDTLAKIFKLAKQEKSLFESISRKYFPIIIESRPLQHISLKIK